MNKEMDMIELEDGTKMPVIDAINFEGKTYVLVGILGETDLKDELYVYEKDDDAILAIEDNDLLEKLIKAFENRLKLYE